MSNFLRNSTRLEELELSNNTFYGSIPSISVFPFFKILSLERNQLNGSFIEKRLRLPNFSILDVSENRLTGSLPDLTLCSSLEIFLNENMFNGTLTESIGYLSSLDTLDIQKNNLEGILTDSHLFSISKLKKLDLSFNLNLTLRISSRWNLPFQLDTLKLAYCNLGPNFPQWLKNQTQLYELDISGSQIYDTVPDWFRKISSWMHIVNMSHNHIYGVIPDLLQSPNIFDLDLSYNELNGSVPLLSSNYLDLSRNKFSGAINNFCNNYTGFFLDLSDNLLSGEISEECFMHLMNLEYLNLGNNNISGEIPSTTGRYCELSTLHLRNNSFRGQLPTSLRNCSYLQILDLGENYFTGNIPTWIGDSLRQLGVLSPRKNDFHGPMPSNLCRLENIGILDFSANRISGIIPKCISNLSSMSFKNNTEYNFMQMPNLTVYVNSANIMWKGRDEVYSKTLWMVKVIDLSSNRIVGVIPPEITGLVGLVGLNLSRNNLVESIPHDIGQLEFLNFLDLSDNNLSGAIPTTISQLNHLGVMNLSFNDLSDRIPWTAHSKTFGSATYVGNPELCGPPLTKPCPGDNQIPKSTSHADGSDNLEEEDMYITKGFYVSMAIGFIVAFSGIFGTLIFTEVWSAKLSKLLIVVADWLFVKIAVSKNRLQRFVQN